MRGFVLFANGSVFNRAAIIARTLFDKTHLHVQQWLSSSTDNRIHSGPLQRLHSTMKKFRHMEEGDTRALSKSVFHIGPHKPQTLEPTCCGCHSHCCCACLLTQDMPTERRCCYAAVATAAAATNAAAAATPATATPATATDTAACYTRWLLTIPGGRWGFGAPH